VKSIFFQLRWKDFWTLLKATVSQYGEQAIPRYGAAFSFYAILSIAPTLLLLVTLVGLLMGKESAQMEAMRIAAIFFGSSGVVFLGEMIEAIPPLRMDGLSAVIHVGVIVLAATGIQAELTMGLNRLWGVRPPGQWRSVLVRRLRGVAILLGMALLLGGSAGAAALIRLGSSYIQPVFPYADLWIQAANLLLLFLLMMIFIGMLYRWLADATPRWEAVGMGACMASGLLLVGNFMIGLYLNSSILGSYDEVTRSILALLVWVYWFGQILYFGAEFAKQTDNFLNK